ncbi:outer membrane protein [Oceaniglobus roseus]|uniref:outer membrane protein n=1 Tax=Oceaniglobus roseus TaxID=1737570 RepID=UPI000C7EB08B|nr:outer membrane beta-barrel protein [Kandeliimicrobium roseum]
MKIIATTAILSAAAFPAFAGGLTQPQPEPVIAAPVAPAPVYSGADWTGGYVGAQLSYGDLNADTGVVDDGASGVVGGLNAGYLYDFGKFVVGGELSANAADLDFDSGNGSIDSLTQAKLKMGYDAGRTLLYGTIGAAYADGTIGGVGANDFGYEVGAGIDYMVTENVSVGGEVTYNRFDDFDGTGTDIDATTVGANVAYHF